MKSFRLIVILCMIYLSGVTVHPVSAQDLDARSPQKAASKGKQRQAEKKKVKQAKLLEKAIKKGKKRHMKLQKKGTKKMMRKSKHQSANFNHDRKEFFLKRWFRKKHH